MEQRAWYVLQTKPKKEASVVQLLSRARYEVFTPRIQFRSGPAQTLFPNYCFIYSDLRAMHHFHLVRFTRGVARVLGGQAGPLPVDGAIIDTLRALANDGTTIEPRNLFQNGMQVRVKQGVLRDLIGIVDRNLSTTGRVRILFRWCAYSWRVDLDYRLIEHAA